MYVGVFFKRYIQGLWCVAEGLVYSMFDEDKHVKDKHMTGEKEWVVSVDYGTVNPFGHEGYFIKEEAGACDTLHQIL